MRCVDEQGRQIFELPAEFAGGDIEVLRRDLSRVLHGHSAEHVEYLFGDAVTELAQTAEAPELYFDSISRVSVPRWSNGRIALLGDAGFGEHPAAWAWARASSARMCWPVSSPPPRATTARRSPPTSVACAATPPAGNEAPTRAGHLTRPLLHELPRAGIHVEIGVVQY